jgi:hypothetical protein
VERTRRSFSSPAPRQEATDVGLSPAFVRYAVLALAAVLVVTLAWRGVRWTLHPPPVRNAQVLNDGAPVDATSTEAAPWQRDFAYALASARTDATTGNIAAAEISVDRAESFVTVARLQSLAAQPEFITYALSELDEILNQRPDDSRLLEHVTLARIALAELESSLAPGGPSGDQIAAVDDSRAKHVAINAPREIAAGQTLDRRAFGGSYLDATLMPDTAEILLPPYSRAFVDNIRVENLTIAGASQTLDGIRWRNVTFIGTRLRYEGGELDLQNVRFVRCRFGFPADARGAALANAIATGHKTFSVN